MTPRSAIATFLVLGISSAAAGQRPVQRPLQRPRLDAPAPGLGQQQPANRAALEQRVRQALARVARERIKLTDDQMRQLAQVDQQFAVQRRQLNRDERDTRLALAAAMRDTVSPDQAKISSYIDQLIAAQRKRIDLVAAEQKELSAFMSPLQRAQYQALQERVRRRLEQLRAGGPPAGAPAGPPPP